MRNGHTASPTSVSFCLPTSRTLLALVNAVPEAGGGICKHPTWCRTPRDGEMRTQHTLVRVHGAARSPLPEPRSFPGTLLAAAGTWRPAAQETQWISAAPSPLYCANRVGAAQRVNPAAVFCLIPSFLQGLSPQ